MKISPSVSMLNVLDEPQLRLIHENSLTLLRAQGVKSESGLIFDIFRRAGADVDVDTRVVRVPPSMVEEALRLAPKSFVIYGREEKMDLLAEAGRAYFGMGGTSEPFVWDYKLGRPRQPTVDDMVASTRIGQAAENIDFMMALCSAGDVPKSQIYLHEYDAIFRNTSKPVIYTAPGRRFAARFIEMAIAASGGEGAFRKRPWIVLYTQPICPLVIGSYSEGMVDAAAMGIPLMASPGPMMGATSPVSLAGTLVQVNAEALFNVVLAQVIKPGTPVIYAPHTGVMDMVAFQSLYGSPEQALARAAVGQLGRFYNLPTFGTGGGVEAKLPDAEAAAEAMMGLLLNALSGLTLTQTLGTMASGLYGSPEMLIICDEMVHMIKRVLAGVRVDDEMMALDVIREVGHGGHFMGHDHTVRHFRDELFFPLLFKRQSVAQWTERGGKSIVDVAHERVEWILAHSGTVELPPGASEALDLALQEAVDEIGTS
jgi:trimethylamine--corrinoid protein Co-methyltransferase